MRRTKELVTLSWEHHDGLVFAFRLQQGLNKGADLASMRDYILHTWDTALDHHFWQEEEVLVGMLEANDEGRKLLNKMLEDHKFLRAAVKNIRKEKKMDPKSIQTFTDYLNRHIRFEEWELFPFLEASLSPAALLEIGNFLKEHHDKADKSWLDEFWKNPREENKNLIEDN